MRDDSVPEGFKMTEIGPLPDQWELMELSALADVKGGKRLPKGHSLVDEVSPYPYIRVLDFANYSVSLASLKYLTPAAHKLIERYTISSNDVYISIAGTIGVVGTIPEALEDANLTENAARIVITDGSRLDRFYLVGYLSSMLGRKQIERRTTKTSQPKLALTRIEQIPIPIPPLTEQKKIAAVLSAVQEAKEKTEAVIEAARELKKSLMNHLLTYGPVPVEDAENVPLKETEIGLVPEEWEVVKLGEVADFKNGINFTKDQKGKSGILTIDVLNMYGEGIYVNLSNLYRVDKEINDDYLLKSGDVLFVRSSLEREGVGWTSLFEETEEKVTFCGFIIRARLKFVNISPEFLVNYLRTSNARENLIASSEKVAITNINQGMLGGISILIPPLPVQQETANILSAVDRKIEMEENKKKALEELFKTLLNNLMTGRIRVKELTAGGGRDASEKVD